MRDIGCWIVEDKDGLLGASHIQIHTHTHTQIHIYTQTFTCMPAHITLACLMQTTF